MKTILEWLKTIPNEDTRAKAINNYYKAGLYDESNSDVENLYQAITLAFWWKDTPEGLDYWEIIADEIALKK